MFCEKCGAPNAEHAEFCTSCGAKLNKTNTEHREFSISDQNNKKNRKIGIIAVVVVVIVVVLIGVVLFVVRNYKGTIQNVVRSYKGTTQNEVRSYKGTIQNEVRSYKDTVQKYIDASVDVDAEAILDLTPDKLIDYAFEEDGDDSVDLDGLIDDLNEQLQDQMDSVDSYLGENWEFSYEIINEEDIKGSDLDDIKDMYEDADIKVSAAKTVEVEFTVKSDEIAESNDTFTMDISLIKVGRSWYLDVLNM